MKTSFDGSLSKKCCSLLACCFVEDDAFLPFVVSLEGKK